MAIKLNIDIKNLSNLPSGKKQHVNQKQLDLDYQTWINNGKDDYYFQEIIYPQIQTIMGMLLAKLYPNITPDHFTKRENNDIIYKRMISGKVDMDNLISGMWSVFFSKVLRDFDSTKGTLFSVCYKYFWNEARTFYMTNINNLKNKNVGYINEIAPRDENGEPIIDSLKFLAEKEEDEEEETNELLNDLREFANNHFVYPQLNPKLTRSVNMVAEFKKLWADEKEFNAFKKLLETGYSKRTSLITPLIDYYTHKQFDYNKGVLTELNLKLLSDFATLTNRKIRCKYVPKKHEIKNIINVIKFKPVKVKVEKVIKIKAVKPTNPIKPARQKYGKQFIGWGESKTISQWSNDNRNINNLSIGCLTKRINKMKMTIEEAFKLSRQKPAKSVLFFCGYGETKPLNEWVKDNRNIHSLTYMGLHSRVVKKKYTIEEAFSFSQRPQRPKKIRFEQ